MRLEQYSGIVVIAGARDVRCFKSGPAKVLNGRHYQDSYKPPEIKPRIIKVRSAPGFVQVGLFLIDMQPGEFEFYGYRNEITNAMEFYRSRRKADELTFVGYFEKLNP